MICCKSRAEIWELHGEGSEEGLGFREGEGGKLQSLTPALPSLGEADQCPLQHRPCWCPGQGRGSAGAGNWDGDEIQMSSPPRALGPSAVPITSSLFNLAAANQPRWDWLLFSCFPQEQLRDRFCQELGDFCPQDLTSSVWPCLACARCRSCGAEGTFGGCWWPQC